MTTTEPDVTAAADAPAKTHRVQLQEDFAGGAFLLPDGRLIVAAPGGAGAAIRLEPAAARELATALNALVDSREPSR
jgi:hypothetical protein